jgi:hypothetical protein
LTLHDDRYIRFVIVTRHTKKNSVKTAAPAAVETPKATSTEDIHDMGNRSLLATSHGLIFINGNSLKLEPIPGESGCWRMRDPRGRTVVSLIDWDGNLPLSLKAEILE